MDREILFYDGDCGLCHRSVQFVLARDEAERFHFAPLDGPTFRERVPEATRSDLPDTMVLLTRDGRMLIRSDAAVHVLRALGGPWRFAARGLELIPKSLRDAGYDFIARIRKRLFRAPEGECPLVAPPLRARFEP